MRWEIKTKTETTSDSKKVITTKKQYITIGDIIGAGKSVIGAVKNAVRQIPGWIKVFKNNGQTASANLAQTALNIATPLAAIVTGAEYYKTATNVINTLTPIMKLIARGTGIWCSPGNAADIGNIVLGTVQQLLVALVTQAIIALKDWLWNIEIPLQEITTEASYAITKNLKEASNSINKKVTNSFSSSNLNLGVGARVPGSSGSDADADAAKKALEDIYKELDEKATAIALSQEQLDKLAKAIASGTYPNFADAWTTVYYLKDADGNDTTHFRQLRGSTNNYGIQYSDIDSNGNLVWKDSNKKDGSFCCFAKLSKADGSVVYLAGSMPYIRHDKLVAPTDENWSKDDAGKYNKDYFTYKTARDFSAENENFKRLEKAKKDSKTLAAYSVTSPTRLFQASGTTNPSIGIWLSVDNGVSWVQASSLKDEYIGNMFEFGEKAIENSDETCPSTVVAASYDYRGLYYSVDGVTWTPSKLNGEDLTNGRFISIYDSANDKARITAEPIAATASIQCTVYTMDIANYNPIDVEIKQPAIEITVEGNNDKLLKKRRLILDYIHEHYKNYGGDETYLRKFDGAFWEQLITDIDSNTYTLENAQRGDRIIE